MDFFVLILFSVFVYLIPGNDKDYLAVQSTSGMKGIMAIMIIFHHISQHVTTGITFSNFNYMGWYIVSVFFFLSGYGLYTQFTIKDNYLILELVVVFICIVKKGSPKRESLFYIKKVLLIILSRIFY